MKKVFIIELVIVFLCVGVFAAERATSSRRGMRSVENEKPTPPASKDSSILKKDLEAKEKALELKKKEAERAPIRTKDALVKETEALNKEITGIKAEIAKTEAPKEAVNKAILASVEKEKILEGLIAKQKGKEKELSELNKEIQQVTREISQLKQQERQTPPPPVVKPALTQPEKAVKPAPSQPEKALKQEPKQAVKSKSDLKK